MDSLRFREACDSVINRERAQNGIGTLGEKTLHAVLKYYYEPYEQSHETKIGGYVADIVGENGVIEIQTRSFDRLRKKLAAFLEVCTVTVVYPVPAAKWLIWIDEQTGEATPRRKSPRRGTPMAIFPELYRIKPLLTHPNLRLRVVLLDMEEYRYLNGWSRDKKKGSTRCDRIPTGLVEEVGIDCAADYAKLMPGGLPDCFTSRDFAGAGKISLAWAHTALNVLTAVGAVDRTGKQGRLYTYEKINLA